VRIALGLSYNGARFDGWQTQPTGRGVQDHVERALASVAGEPVRVAAAGRTDAGVHATAQVVHFDTSASRPLSAWVRGVNAHLEPAVAVEWARPVEEGFHARFSAFGRRYHYLLYSWTVRPSVLADLAGWFHQPLDAEAMRQASRCLLGQHDFSSFRAAECQARTPVRELRALNIAQQGRCMVFEFSADGFLHHMVRNIIGALIYVGAGRQPPGWIAELLTSRDRRAAAPTFSPAGLYLTGVFYPPQFEIQAEWVPPWFASACS